MRDKIGRKTVDKLKAEKLEDEDENIVGQVDDSDIRGFSARRLPSGRVQYFFRYQVERTRRFKNLGYDGEVTPEEARKEALLMRAMLSADKDPLIEEAKAKAVEEAEKIKRTEGNFASVAAKFIKLHAREENRAWRETLRIFRKYVPKDVRRRPINEIMRSHVTDILDRVQKNNGPVMADRVLAALRKLFNWHAARTDHFVSPVIRGMARTKPTERARKRRLNDAEIRALWEATETTEPAIFGPFVRALLLTGQRRGEVAEMTWAEMDPRNASRRRTLEEEDLAALADQRDIWVIPKERYKTKRPNIVPLSTITATFEKIKHRHGFVFSSDGGRRAIGGFTKPKKMLDEKMLAELRKANRKAELPHWTLHDLRRTAKTLMAAAGVRPDISERVLGHVIAGVEGTYDQHHYIDEKRHALEALAQRLEIILKGEPAKILEMKRGRDATQPAQAG